MQVTYGPNRVGDIPHSLASIAKAKSCWSIIIILPYSKGLKETIDWYWNNLRSRLLVITGNIYSSLFKDSGAQ
jgi:UDP-N-acetylglucosamine 4-epimerase